VNRKTARIAYWTSTGAFASRLLSGDRGLMLLSPPVFLAITCVPYYFWKQYEAAQAVV
jgi:hypothetical protein